MPPLSRQDEQFLKMINVQWEARQAPTAGKPAAAETVSRENYDEAVRMAYFYEEESHGKSEQVKRLQRQLTWCFIVMVAAGAGLVAAASILATIKIAF